MPKYKRLLLPALLAAGAMLLTACDLGASAADGKQNTSTTANSTPDEAADEAADDANAEEGTEGEDDPLGYSSTPPEGGCGETSTDDGRTVRLLSDEGSLGYVTCDEATRVMFDFDMLDDQVEIPADGIDLPSGWHCDATVDAGVTVGVECYTPTVPDPANPILLRFHTELM